MYKFTEKHIGSRVRPTQDTVSTEYHTFKSVDEIFTISEIYGEFCAVVSQIGEEHRGWFHDRFELVDETKYKVGDKVVFTYEEDSIKVYIGYYVGNDGEDDICELDRGNFIPDAWMTTEYGLPLATGMYLYCTAIRKYEEPVVGCDWGLGNSEAVWSNVSIDSPKLTKSTLDGMYNLMAESMEHCAFGQPMHYKLPNVTDDGVAMYNIRHGDVIIKSNYIKYKDMNIIDKIRVNIKGEPMKTLIKNDILTLDERLTTTGKELFNDFLYAKFKDEFIADLAPKLEGLNDKE